MIRSDEFKLSQRPYAVDLSTLQVSNGRHGQVKAVWFRRRNRQTVACIGNLWDIQKVAPSDAVAFLEAHDDGRYGGRCWARWDGTTLWTKHPAEPATQVRWLATLRPMLENYPALPQGFDGWWCFNA